MSTPEGFGYPTPTGLRTVKLHVNFGCNVKGDVCGIPTQTAIEYVMAGLADPVGWSLKGNGKETVQPDKKKAKPKAKGQ